MGKFMQHTFCLFLACQLLPLSAQTVIDVRDQFNCAWAGGAEVDLNNDGYLDLMYGGEQLWIRDYFDENCNFFKNTNFVARVHLYNPVKRKYEDIHTNYFVGARPSLVFTDMNGDGIMDLVAGEYWKNQGDFYGGGIYLGNGDGNFHKQEMTFDPSSFVFKPTAVAVSDFNNDGLPDIVCSGYDIVNGQNVSRAALLINEGDFHFKVTEENMLSSPLLDFVCIKPFDCNNDGYMDFIVQGTCALPAQTNNSEFFADIYVNAGESNPGTFSRLNIASFVRPKANGGFNFADFDGDGWLDFFITGDAFYDTNNNINGESEICINQKNGSFKVKAEPNLPINFRTYNSTSNATRTIDWNGDGYYDLIIPGYQPASSSGLNTQVAYYFLNDGTGLFREGVRIPGATECNILFPDWNGDGILDYLVQGQSWDNTYFAETGKVAAVMLNPNKRENVRPSSPQNLKANVKGDCVTLSWDPATDVETPSNSLSYEYFLKDMQGHLYTACRSHIGGQLDGKRKVLELGNAMLNHVITLHHLPCGSYTWGVQSIDASYEGSLFSTGDEFSIIDTHINSPDSGNVITYTKDHWLYVKSAEISFDVFVYDVNGILVQSGFNRMKHDFYLQAGIYILKISTSNGNIIYKKTIV